MQLELGAAAPHFENRDLRDLRDRELGTIVRDRGTAAGWYRGTPGFPAGFPRQHLLLPGGTVPPVS